MRHMFEVAFPYIFIGSCVLAIAVEGLVSYCDWRFYKNALNFKVSRNAK